MSSSFAQFWTSDFVKQFCSWGTRIYWPRIYHDETRNKYYFSCLRERSHVRNIALSAGIFRALLSRPIVRTRRSYLLSNLTWIEIYSLPPCSIQGFGRSYFNAISRYDYSVISFAVYKTALAFRATKLKQYLLSFFKTRDLIIATRVSANLARNYTRSNYLCYY